MFTIYFTKRFLSGVLAGLSVRTNISFDSTRIDAMAKKYRHGAKGRDCVTGTQWIITDASFQSYAR